MTTTVEDIQTATLASPSRRLPPPCWTEEEASALIDAYRDKWYSLRRGTLRAAHWKKVADAVESLCAATPPKTAVQCRHKMEKLRKRYRAEIQRGGGSRFPLFHKLHMMECGSENPPPPPSDTDRRNSIAYINHLYHLNNHRTSDSGTAGEIRNPKSSKSARNNASHRVPTTKTKPDEKGLHELAEAISSLGEGILKTEMAKMEIVKQMEEAKTKMALQRMELILNTYRNILPTKKARRS